jgi:hypothetical protein
VLQDSKDQRLGQLQVVADELHVLEVFLSAICQAVKERATADVADAQRIEDFTMQPKEAF